MSIVLLHGDAERVRQRLYWRLWAATLLFFGGFYTLLVPLPRYLAIVGLDDWQIGFVLGVFGVAALVTRPFAGMVVDRWGTRSVLLVGAGALLVGATAVPFITHVAALVALRVVQAAGYVAFTTAGTALVITSTPVKERGQRLAIFGAAANVAIMLAPPVVSALLMAGPLAMAFFVAGGFALAAGGLVVTCPPIVSAPRSATRRLSLRVPRPLWVPMLVAGLFGAGFGAFLQFAPILAERRGTLSAGALYVIYGSGIIATRLVSARVNTTHAPGSTIGLASGLLAAGLGLAAVAQGLLGPTLATLLIAAGCGLLHPALLVHHAALLPAAPGQASALFYAGFDLGIGLGNWLEGGALQVAGIGGLYGFAALLVALALPLAPLLARQQAQLAA